MASITVVGGGLAGLACGWRLRRAGHDVRLLERGPTLGGRARSERRGAFELDVGCPAVSRGQHQLLALVEEAGLLGSLRPFAYGRDLHWRDAGLAPIAPEGVLRRVASLRRPDASRALLRGALDRGRRSRLFDPGRRVSPARVLRDAAADALCWWPAREPEAGASPGRAALSEARPLAFGGGLGALTDALAERLDVVRDCEVTRVETDSAGAHVSLRSAGEERRERADAVVVAVPAPRVAPLCPKLTPSERGFFEATRFESGSVVQLLFERAPRAVAWRSVRFGPESGLEVASLAAMHAKPGAAPHGAALLRAVLSEAAARRMHRASDASVADLVLENLAYSPVGPLRPDGFAVFRHPDLAPHFDRGHAQRLCRFASRLDRSPRLAFAGDALAGPGVDGAVASGLWAAAEITCLV